MWREEGQKGRNPVIWVWNAPNRFMSFKLLVTGWCLEPLVHICYLSGRGESWKARLKNFLSFWLWTDFCTCRSAKSLLWTPGTMTSLSWWMESMSQLLLVSVQHVVTPGYLEGWVWLLLWCSWLCTCRPLELIFKRTREEFGAIVWRSKS